MGQLVDALDEAHCPAALAVDSHEHKNAHNTALPPGTLAETAICLHTQDGEGELGALGQPRKKSLFSASALTSSRV